DELALPAKRYAREAAGARSAAPAEYADPGFWERRFDETEGTFDWYATYRELEGVFSEFCPPVPGLDVLVVGCGNSALSGELWQAGYQRVTNIDISAAAVSKMEERFAGTGMSWQVMNATAMDFEDCSFDLAVDKGTLDAMMCGGAAGSGDAAGLAAETWRTLRPGGLLLLVSHNGGRRPLLDRAVEELHGAGAGWEQLELRKCRLSPQATLINILRSKLPGRPLSEALGDAKLLAEAAVEARQALKQMAFLEAFHAFRARKARLGECKAPAPAAPPSAEPDDADDGEEPQPSRSDGHGVGDPSSRRQPWCWVYVLRKPAAVPP
ncbi:unnamed protein product, partial [Prorocentrum cordatum]